MKLPQILDREEEEEEKRNNNNNIAAKNSFIIVSLCQFDLQQIKTKTQTQKKSYNLERLLWAILSSEIKCSRYRRNVSMSMCVCVVKKNSKYFS